MTETTATATTGAATAPEDGRWFLDTWMRIINDGGTTDGKLATIEWRGGQGFSPPLHVHHDEDTAMYVIEGRLTVLLDGEEKTCGPGEMAWLPRDVPHSFRIDSDEAHYLEVITPAGFEDFHLEGSRAVTSGGYLPTPQPVDGPALTAHAAQHNCDIIGPPMA